MHADHPGFGDAVAMVSLGDDWAMEFSREGATGPTREPRLWRWSAARRWC